nr:hypothetical protein RU989_pgp214 [Laurencia obtusa]WMP12797.1 hypothetical protein [Laurencia obtusa]
MIHVQIVLTVICKHTTNNFINSLFYCIVIIFVKLIFNTYHLLS